ncbi:9427_t:CDS:2 [Funneliformis geosporum]|uniref:9427_t:CDS:1 n=1 Tax=Funneliformis geosporum TaxID=1117311 RepID=A0A9W4T2F6_9GLOM|nr:9427_t:CDS:2 [Funneliformis geosporum]
MARLKEEEQIQICILLDKKLYMPVELAKRYSQVIRYIKSGEYSNATEVKKLQSDYDVKVTTQTI